MLDKNGIAKRISKEIKSEYYINLGIGIPTLVAIFVLFSQNGLDQIELFTHMLSSFLYSEAIM